MDAREVALLALSDSARRDGGWSDGALKKRLGEARLDRRDAALATHLCYGVVQNRMLLDYYLSRFSNTPLKRMEIKVVILLRLGLFQMLFLTRVPHSAAVSSAVELTHKYCKNARAAGLVNGILRAVERKLDDLPALPAEDRAEYLSVRYSHPLWLVKRLGALLDDDSLVALLEANNAVAPLAVQVNTLRVERGALVDRLVREGVEALPHPWLDNCLILNGTGNLEELESYRNGLLFVQDPAARLAVLAAGAKPEMRVLDCCAAPGGKSFALCLDMADRGEVLSCDLHPHKKALLLAGRDRLGFQSMTPMTADASRFRPEWEGAFDLVLADVPCSGLGVIRKKPDVRYKDPVELAQLPTIQLGILNNVARYVKAGGTLVYSTCTILPEENEQVVDRFVSDHDDFVSVPFSLPAPAADAPEGRITLWPQKHGTDGFFIAKLARRQV